MRGQAFCQAEPRVHVWGHAQGEPSVAGRGQSPAPCAQGRWPPRWTARSVGSQRTLGASLESCAPGGGKADPTCLFPVGGCGNPRSSPTSSAVGAWLTKGPGRCALKFIGGFAPKAALAPGCSQPMTGRDADTGAGEVRGELGPLWWGTWDAGLPGELP